MGEHAAMAELHDRFQAEWKKFTEKGNRAAGTRARAALQDMKAMATAIRNHIQETKKQLKEN